MTKLSKILLCICLSIICICGVVSNTYCFSDAPNNLFSISGLGSYSELPNSPNYYNSGNLNYVKYKNFYCLTMDNYLLNAYVDNDANLLSCPYLNAGPRIVEDEVYVYDKYNHYKIGIAKRTLNYIYDLAEKHLQIYCSNPEFIINNYSYTNDILNSGHIRYYSLGYDFEKYLNNVTFIKVTFSTSTLFRFDINYYNQYFYNNVFGVVCHNDNDLRSSGKSLLNLLSIYFYDNNGFRFHKDFDTQSIYFYYIFLLENNFNYNGSYINTVEYHSNFLFERENFKYNGFSCNYFSFSLSDTTINASQTLFSFNTLNLNNGSGALIPIGSNDYYKTAAWYDIPTHLYNFFIYLVFDAPIISNFTKLAMVIINFLVETFNFVIGLFNGVSNVFFISIFVGMLALIFLLKIIFGGKT